MPCVLSHSGHFSFKPMTIVQEGVENLGAYASIPIRFLVESESRWKDYDEYETPTSMPIRFDMTNWAIFAAFEGNRRIGVTGSP